MDASERRELHPERECATCAAYLLRHEVGICRRRRDERFGEPERVQLKG